MATHSTFQPPLNVLATILGADSWYGGLFIHGGNQQTPDRAVLQNETWSGPSEPLPKLSLKNMGGHIKQQIPSTHLQHILFIDDDLGVRMIRLPSLGGGGKNDSTPLNIVVPRILSQKTSLISEDMKVPIVAQSDAFSGKYKVLVEEGMLKEVIDAVGTEKKENLHVIPLSFALISLLLAQARDPEQHLKLNGYMLFGRHHILLLLMCGGVLEHRHFSYGINDILDGLNACHMGIDDLNGFSCTSDPAQRAATEKNILDQFPDDKFKNEFNTTLNKLRRRVFEMLGPDRELTTGASLTVCGMLENETLQGLKEVVHCVVPEVKTWSLSVCIQPTMLADVVTQWCKVRSDNAEDDPMKIDFSTSVTVFSPSAMEKNNPEKDDKPSTPPSTPIPPANEDNSLKKSDKNVRQALSIGIVCTLIANVSISIFFPGPKLGASEQKLIVQPKEMQETNVAQDSDMRSVACYVQSAMAALPKGTPIWFEKISWSSGQRDAVAGSSMRSSTPPPKSKLTLEIATLLPSFGHENTHDSPPERDDDIGPILDGLKTANNCADEQMPPTIELTSKKVTKSAGQSISHYTLLYQIDPNRQKRG